jgi:hypothetical protein
MDTALPRRNSWIVPLASGLIVGLVATHDVTARADGEESGDALIQRVVAQATRSGIAVRALRDLRVDTRGGKHDGWMEVETRTTPAGAFSWTVLDEGGSDRVRNKVFRELLETEAKAMHDGSREAAALTPANYVFLPMGTSADGQTQIHLAARRADARLVNGTLTVGKDGAPVLLEGQVAKSPSFWIKSVTVVKRFGKVAGVVLPTSVETLADVKIVGQATFTMRYRYREVDGRPITDALASSAPLLAKPTDLLRHK